jgi:predicted nucleic acid-binding protein
MKIVISDTSPIRALVHLDLLQLLADFFGQVVIPPAVWDELSASGTLEHLPVFIVVESPKNRITVDSLLEELELGEAEALAIAIESDEALLLLDERKATAIARAKGVSTIGVIGLLLQAKHDGRIDSLKDCIDKLRSGLRFFLAPKVIARVLREAGEIQ